MASKRETLLEYLKTLLAGITQANGYNTTVKTVERGVRSIRENMNANLPALFITMNHEKRDSITYNQFKADLQVIIVGFVKNNKGSVGGTGTGVELDLDRLVEDVTKILETDRKQGNRVYSTEITDVATDPDDNEPTAGMVMSVVFRYTSTGIAP
jgi:hypothetical protein